MSRLLPWRLLSLHSTGWRHTGFSSGSMWPQQLRHMDLVAQRHVESSWTRGHIHVPCIGRWMLNHWSTREVLSCTLSKGVNTRKPPSSQSYGFSSSHVWMWELDHKEGWVPKTWCFWTVVLVKTLESPLDCKEIQPVHPKGNQSWIFIGGTDAEAEAPIFWPPNAKSQLIRNDPDAGQDLRQQEKGTTEDKIIGWHHCLDGHESEQAPRDCEGQGGLACCSPWGCKELDMPERLTNNNNQETRSTMGAISKAATVAGTSWLLSPSAESWLISGLRGEVSLHILGQK